MNYPNENFTALLNIWASTRKKAALIMLLGVGSLCVPIAATATALPSNTELRITQGVGSAPNFPCLTGSCFGMEVSPGFLVWTDFGPGTDRGFVLGKNQLSGGQETGPSSGNTTSGELTAAWLFFGNYGTFYTVPGGDTNVFDDADCAGTACIGKTELKVWNTAWNGGIFPMGSAAGCAHANCSADQLAGIFVSSYTISPVTGGAWSMNYSQVVPSGQFLGVKYSLVLRGVVTIPPPLANAGNDQQGIAAGSLVSLSGTCTGQGSNISDCAWTQTAGTTVTLSESKSGLTTTSATNSATFTAPTATNGQTLTFRLTATDTSSNTATDDVNVDVLGTGLAPVAGAGSDLTKNENTTFTLSGTCTDADGTVSSCLWSVVTSGITITTQSASGTGTASATATATVQTPSVLQDTAYTLRLTATDDTNNTHFDEMLVTVKNVVAQDTNQPSTTGCSLSQGTPVNLLERSDWWLVLGFIAWLGIVAHRHRRQPARA